MGRVWGGTAACEGLTVSGGAMRQMREAVQSLARSLAHWVGLTSTARRAEQRSSEATGDGDAFTFIRVLLTAETEQQ